MNVPQEEIDVLLDQQKKIKKKKKNPTKKLSNPQEISSHYKVRSLRLDFYDKDQFISAAHLLFDVRLCFQSLLTLMEIYPFTQVHFGLGPL